MEKSFLVIGTGEVGIAMLDSLYKYKVTSTQQFTVGALVQPSSAGNESAPHSKYAGLAIEAVDLVSESIENLAGRANKRNLRHP